MAQKLILESTLSNIANAIRSVDGTTDLIDPADFAARISAFSVGAASPKAIIKVVAPEGSDVSATDGTETLTGTVGSAQALFLLLPTSGSWTVNVTVDGEVQTITLTVVDYDYQIIKPNPYLRKINEAIAAGSLDSFSWTEIEEIANMVTIGDILVKDVSGLLGLSKSFVYNDSTTCYAFIIGILQDYLDKKSRGLTFWCVGSNNPFNTSAKQLHITTSEFGSSGSSSGGWGGTGRGDILRKALQPGGTIYNNMPSEMTAVMKPKTTYYGPTNSSTTTTVSSITDTMFLLSAKELYNADMWSLSYNYPYYKNEGTGIDHNEQYQLFAKEGITRTVYSTLACTKGCWLRTCYPMQSGKFDLLYTRGELDYNTAIYTHGVTPCFCV